jgi:hypothetical protein
MHMIKHGQPGLAMAGALILAGCAANVPGPTLTESPLNGAYTLGTIVAVRDPAAAAGSAGLASVLAALNQPAGTAPGAQELVIRRADRSITSLVQIPAPGEAPFQAGENVAIITASETIIRRE